MNVPFPGGKGYVFGAVGAWLLFLTAVVMTAVGRQRGWPEPLVALVAAAPTVIAAIQFVIAYRLVARQDEFVRSLFAKRMLIAAAMTIVLAIAWSSAELMGAPHLPAWLLYPLIWGLFGALTPLIRGSRA